MDEKEIGLTIKGKMDTFDISLLEINCGVAPSYLVITSDYEIYYKGCLYEKSKDLALLIIDIVKVVENLR